ncbi:peptidoglycan-recognition protein 3-like [Macrosteles quadrilineatus]|uniref:peptidoglycan-recognition protein 3-like n=1 Tax=Macrosteles quadrilineatus TaxID=74068 RepID=UPI0023E23F19|nr:peptidoglycan-recognition protein 3-like [Macrosteles quadrilineatus]
MAATVNFSIATRARWGAEPPLSKVSLKHPVPYVRTIGVGYVDACTTEEECVKQMKAIQKHDMYDGKQQDIQANFLIGDDGKVYEGRGWFSAPPDYQVPKAFHGKYLLIGHIGGKSTVKPTEKFVEAKENLIKMGTKRRFIMDPHSVI